MVEKLQLDVGPARLLDPAVGGVDVLPAVVIEVGEHRAPEPSPWIRGGPARHVIERPVAAIPEQVVAAGHLPEHVADVRARLPEDLIERWELLAPGAALP